MTYQWKSGSRFNVPAQAAGEQCKALADAGNLSAKTLVDANRAEDAPLHPAFEWRDEVAAEEYRKEQARHIIRSLVLVSDTDGAEPEQVFCHIEESGATEYKAISVVLQNEDETAALLRQLYRDAETFTRKYRKIAEKAGNKAQAVIIALDGLLAEKNV